MLVVISRHMIFSQEPKGRQMAQFKILIGLAAVSLLASESVSAKPKRAVVLLDFVSAPVDPEPVEPSGEDYSGVSGDVDAVTRLIARQFTGAGGDMELPGSRQPSLQRSAVNPAALGNPFVLHALSPNSLVPPVGRTNANDCSLPMYQPSFGFSRIAEQRRRQLYPLVHRVACEAGLPVGLFDALIMQESRYHAGAVSHAGAIGLAQLMPGTAKDLGVNPHSPIDNLRGGARYLKQQVDRFGRYDLALAAYNAGPGRVERRWKVPRIAETQDYVRKILGSWSGAPIPLGKFEKPMSFRQAQIIFMDYGGGSH